MSIIENITEAYNPISEITYSGKNQILLTQTFIAENYPTNQWCTYMQAKEHGGQVMKGQKATKCRKAGTNEVQTDTGPVTKRFIRGFSAFNYAQIDWTGETDTIEDISEQIDKQIYTAPKRIDHSAIIEKFRNLAEKLDSQIEAKCADRLTNTPKRQREAASQRMEGDKLKRTQSVLLELAKLYEFYKVPEILLQIKTKKQVYDLVSTKIEHSGGYYDAGFDTGEPRNDEPLTLAVFALLKPKSDSEIQAEKLRDSVESLQFSKIAGYFPTPKAIAEKMIEKADLCAGLRVLEPSAGSGAIADLLPRYVDVVLYEVNHTLSGILEEKAKNLENTWCVCSGCDFLTTTGEYDRVIMNPPFENQQDIDHVLHAFDCLGQLGRIVAVMSPSFQFRQDKKATAFREFLELHNAEVEALPAYSFKESGTSVNTVMVTIDK